jgi:hypothetical protein
MFCLLADVEIHRRTHNRFGLQDALRAVTEASGGLTSEWPIERVLRTGDAVVGTTVLEDLYAQMKDAPVTPDLTSLWRKLGVEPEGASVRLHDDAPLAEVRQAIMQPAPAISLGKGTTGTLDARHINAAGVPTPRPASASAHPPMASARP